MTISSCKWSQSRHNGANEPSPRMMRFLFQGHVLCNQTPLYSLFDNNRSIFWKYQFNREQWQGISEVTHALIRHCKYFELAQLFRNYQSSRNTQCEDAIGKQDEKTNMTLHSLLLCVFQVFFIHLARSFSSNWSNLRHCTQRKKNTMIVYFRIRISTTNSKIICVLMFRSTPSRFFLAWFARFPFSQDIIWASWPCGIFTIRKSDAFLSDNLTNLKLHKTK